jgi:methyl-accepting chemotaxis protein
MSKSLHDFGAGDLDRRISETRNDEIGQLFIAFNRMAEGIQARFGRRNEDEVAPLDAARANALTNSATDTEATLLTNTTQTVVPPVVEAAISRRKHPA